MTRTTPSAIFRNGRIYTFGPDRRRAEAIAVEDGRIVCVGGDIEVKRNTARGSEVHDLRGRTVVPGFIDCHTHFIAMGVDSSNVDLSRTGSLKEALSMMQKAAQSKPEGEWVVGAGWKESGWPGGRFITRADLDGCCPKNPAVAHRVCGHMSSVNSLAISELGIERGTPGAEVGSDGRLNGVLTESAVGIARSATAPDRAQKSEALQTAVKKASSLGVTSIHDNGESEDLSIYRDAEKTGKLGVRVWFNTPSDNLSSVEKLGLVTGLGSEVLKFGGLKVFCDGALGARTAALFEPFSDDPGNRGMLVHRKKKLDEIIARATRAGVQLAVHAIGDRGIDVATSSMRSALRGTDAGELRHRIEHLELPTRGHIKMMKKLGIVASMQPNFIGEWGGTEGMYISRLGRQRASRNNPFREVLDGGVRLVFGSDCMPFSPLYGILSAVNAPFEAQRISALEAVSAYTREAAFASFEENLKGTIARGKCADFVVLSNNPFDSPELIGSTEVVETVLGGKDVFVSRKWS